MGTEPQCERLITSLEMESAYGAATPDGDLDVMLSLVDPVLVGETRDIIDDTDLLKGHEFREDVNAYEILFTDREIPLTNIPATAEFLAWLFARALGDYAPAQIATTGDYTHTSKLMDRCIVGRQLPSSTLGIVWSGSSGLDRKYSGCVVNTLTLRISSRGRVTVDVTFISDGSENAATIAIPSTFYSTNYYFGKDMDAEEADYEGVLVSFMDDFRGLELTINNNLQVDEAKNTNFATAGALPRLNFGDREITVALDVLGDESHDLYIDAVPATGDPFVLKTLVFTLEGNELAGGNNADCVITIPKCVLRLNNKSFDGYERVFQLNTDLFMDGPLETPIMVQTVTRDSSVLITPGS